MPYLLRNCQLVVLFCWPYVHAAPKHSSQTRRSMSDESSSDRSGTYKSCIPDPYPRECFSSLLTDFNCKVCSESSSTYQQATESMPTPLTTTSTFTTTVQASCSSTPAIAGALNSTLVPIITGLITITVVVAAVLVATMILVCLYVRWKTQLIGIYFGSVQNGIYSLCVMS